MSEISIFPFYNQYNRHKLPIIFTVVFTGDRYIVKVSKPLTVIELIMLMPCSNVD